MTDAATALERIPYVNLPAQYAEEREEILAAVDRVFSSGQFVNGPAVGELECDLAGYLGVPYVVTLNSGTDALILAMRALGIGPGDEVITPPNSFVGSTASIVAVGATPVFADVLPDQNIDPERVAAAITPRTRAIMPVHLTGRVADMNPILELADRHGLWVIEDSAQAIGSTYDGRQSGTIGHVGCFSLHPLKNLNAAGDAGFVATRDEKVAEKLRLWRNHGLIDRNSVVEWGTVSRLDTLQAEVLRIRLKALPSVIERRRRNARQYMEELADAPVFVPPERQIEFNTYHTFVVQLDRRDEVQKRLAARGIETGIHYPVPIHLQKAAAHLGHGRGDFPVTERQAGRILTLPVNQSMTPEQVSRVAQELREAAA